MNTSGTFFFPPLFFTLLTVIFRYNDTRLTSPQLTSHHPRPPRKVITAVHFFFPFLFTLLTVIFRYYDSGQTSPQHWHTRPPHVPPLMTISKVKSPSKRRCVFFFLSFSLSFPLFFFTLLTVIFRYYNTRQTSTLVHPTTSPPTTHIHLEISNHHQNGGTFFFLSFYFTNSYI
jgi:hypothetical protein